MFLFITLTSSLSCKQKLYRSALVFAVITIIALPWYLNNYFLFKNPLFPAMSDIFRSYNLFNKEYVKMLHEVLYLDVENFSWAIGASRAFIFKYCEGFGYPAFIGGIIGVLFSFYSKENKSSKFIAIILMLMSIVIMRFGLWEPRYSLVLLPLLGALSTLPINFFLNACAECRMKLDKDKVINVVLIILACLSVYHGFKAFGRIQKIYAFNSEKFFFETSVPGWRVANYLNKNTPTDAKIAVGIGNNQIFYYLNRPYYHLHPLTEKGNLLGVENGNDLIKLLKSENIRYIALSDYYRFRAYNARAPHLYGFLKRINASIDDLLKRQILNQITSIDSDVKIFEVVY